MSEVSYHLAVLLVDLHIPESQSLKDKRMVLRSIKEKARHKFNVSIAELDGHDKWQTATLGFCMIGCDSAHIDHCLQNIFEMIDGFHRVEVCSHQIEYV